MTFEEFAASVDVLTPNNTILDFKSTYSKCLYYRYEDQAGDSLEIRIDLTSAPGKKLTVLQSCGDAWYFSTAFCMWLATIAELIENFGE
jgi:hypothetical protein